MTSASRELRSGRALRIAIILGTAGLVLVGIGWAIEPRQAAFSYLTAYAYWLSVALGALLLVMIHHAINASWFIVLRRLAESIADSLIVFAILFLPILFGLRELYPWAALPNTLPTNAAELLERKRAYLNVPFFLIRAAAYFTIWILVAQKLRQWSLAMAGADLEASVSLAQKQRTLSAAALPAVAFALTFAAFDWLMSLSPTWYSTVYGVYYFAGGFLAALALVAVLAHLIQQDQQLANITVSHVHAVGKLLLTFLVFWAYIGYVQLLLVWIANIPVEAAWYVSRLNTGWSVVGWILLVGHFVLPLLALLSREIKRRTRTLAVVAAWLLVMHYVDVYWLVLPALHPAGPHPHWLDIAALAAIGGCVTAFALWRLRDVPLTPLGDPRLERSARFITQ